MGFDGSYGFAPTVCEEVESWARVEWDMGISREV